MDMCLYLNQHFAFVSFPDELTTGSSIMPHKKNPDVFELIRAHCNKIQALPGEIAMMTVNLPSGYHRDLQLLKENLFPAFGQLRDCLQMASLMLSRIRIKEHILQDEKYKYLFSVEAVNKLVLEGMPFRDAYKKECIDIENGQYTYTAGLDHTHEGSAGNLCNEDIRSMMKQVLEAFKFEEAEEALRALVAG
jgi:argininosuccinate lyase